ncbi:helix-turn-helix transcriptional regulator [Vibrio metschnikovii]|uniref:helix-turn-helix transcriptional regulator n=1 Tax=Vibrio metschnikovii TaxID=28172 RepID=UPI001C2FA199|nr:AlpA family transcriptional regulator [Vibrio metschnikovii]
MHNESIRIIRLKEVMAMTGLSKTSIYRYSADNQFPQSCSLGGRSVGWVESEVKQWLKARIEDREVAA